MGVTNVSRAYPYPVDQRSATSVLLSGRVSNPPLKKVRADLPACAKLLTILNSDALE